MSYIKNLFKKKCSIFNFAILRHIVTVFDAKTAAPTPKNMLRVTRNWSEDTTKSGYLQIATPKMLMNFYRKCVPDKNYKSYWK